MLFILNIHYIIIVLNKFCDVNCFTPNSFGQFFYSMNSNSQFFDFLSFINCSLINNGYMIILTQKVNVFYKF